MTMGTESVPIVTLFSCYGTRWVICPSVKVNTMMKVIVAGAAGRMGQRIGYMVDQHPALVYAGAFEAADSEHIGSDAGELAGIGTNGVIIREGLESVIDAGDVIIDFTFHQATMEFARLASTKHKAMVIGTTGLSAGELKELSDLAAHFPCVQAPNMSVCVNVLLKLVQKTAALLGSQEKGWSEFIVSRGSTVVPSDHLIKEKFIK